MWWPLTRFQDSKMIPILEPFKATLDYGKTAGNLKMNLALAKCRIVVSYLVCSFSFLFFHVTTKFTWRLPFFKHLTIFLPRAFRCANKFVKDVKQITKFILEFVPKESDIDDAEQKATQRLAGTAELPNKVSQEVRRPFRSFVNFSFSFPSLRTIWRWLWLMISMVWTCPSSCWGLTRRWSWGTGTT